MRLTLVVVCLLAVQAIAQVANDAPAAPADVSAGLKTEVARLTKEVSQLKNQVDTLTQKLATANSELKDARQSENSLQTEVKNLKASVQSGSEYKKKFEESVKTLEKLESSPYVKLAKSFASFVESLCSRFDELYKSSGASPVVDNALRTITPVYKNLMSQICGLWSKQVQPILAQGYEATVAAYYQHLHAHVKAAYEPVKPHLEPHLLKAEPIYNRLVAEIISCCPSVKPFLPVTGGGKLFASVAFLVFLWIFVSRALEIFFYFALCRCCRKRAQVAKEPAAVVQKAKSAAAKKK
eukprot:GILI01004268.1.p1 GENE.GILI01004268.1~~GILI01004268.1.p1  ORF type:complete len:312 (+),score=85.39 GILI01004268.1:50-937(+)